MYEISNGLTAIVKVTRNCNLRCKYCSAGEARRLDMNLNDAATCIEKIVTRKPKSHTRFIWHGGEPLLRGIDFYQELLAIQKPLIEGGYQITNALQTNCTLITDDWAAFFKKNDFFIGCSLDGPEEINNRTRQFPSGHGAFKEIIRGSKLLDKHGIKHGFMVVINGQNADHVDEIIDFMHAIKKGFTLSGISLIGRAANDSSGLTLAKNSISGAQINLFERWLKSGSSLDCRAVDRYLSSVISGRPVGCAYMKDCQKGFIGVDYNGDIYPCGRFCDSGNGYKYGNLVTDDFETIWNNPLRIKFSTRTKRLKSKNGKCRSCSYIEICNGGCPADGMLSGDIDQPSVKCGEYRRIFRTLERRIRKEVGL